jgi:hypothetical protein
MFLIAIVVGLAGLVAMALPALGGHGHGHGQAHPGGGQHAMHSALAMRKLEWFRFLPSPRLAFSVLALYGAFGNALVQAAGLRPLVAALVAVLPALVVERFAVAPLWNLAFRFQGKPSSPLGALVLDEAKAVTPFRNGRGVVSVVRDGRLVQFSAHLVEPRERERRKDDAPVRVGDRLLIEEVDADREHLTVSLPEDKV